MGEKKLVCDGGEGVKLIINVHKAIVHNRFIVEER
jgi:hypothetical protein